ncbi:acetyltransferase [Rheinheimera sp. D18]|uniref:LpxL/LpxP family acyltransferase n=1 Tax=Rheinheimera sp. D18 TaxID=2545632 RepID=UPI001044F272|nr:acetyltransferase [Rheinheimera sp. D18]QBL10694.1 acetyltransferase [Rheinheimera sp. D18]
MKAKQTHWAKKQENGSYIAIRMLLTLYRFGGKWLIVLCLAPVLAYFFLKDRSARNASLDFLQQVHQFKGADSPFKHKPGYWQSYLHFWQFAQAALDKIDGWLDRIPRSKVTYGGSLPFENIVYSGKGALIIGSHLGNQEVCRALVRSKYPIKINVLAHTQHTAAFNRILKESSSDVDLRLIEVTELTPAVSVMLSDCIERGELVVIVGDRISAQAPERTVWANFLGKPAPFAIGPWVLASVLQCPVYLMFCLKQQDGYSLMFEPFAQCISIPRKQRQLIITEQAQRYANVLEQVACRYPLQWFNFYDFWQLPGAGQHKEHSGDNSSN